MSEPHPAMQWLRAGVPLSLLLDLASPDGPDTRGIMAAERRDAEACRSAGPLALAGASAARTAAVRDELPDSA